MARKWVTGSSLMAKCLLAVVIFGLLVVTRWYFLDPSVYRFPGLAGPTQASVVGAELATPIGRFGGGQPSRMAVLVTERDSSWLGLVHGLKSFGIPFTLTEDHQQAFRHKVVMVYPVVSGKAMTAQALLAMADFSRGGGTLIATHVLGGGLNGLFGFSEAVSSTAHKRIRFGAENAFVQRYFDNAPYTLAIGSATQPRGTYSYSDPTGTVLAHFEDGSAALVRNESGRGRTYALGLDIGALSLLGHNNRQEGLAKTFANSFEPGLDALYLLLRDLYVQGEPDAVLLGTVPQGMKLSIVLTHDVDYSGSVDNALIYADEQKSHGIAGTYFVQTKYVRDWNDDAFFHGAGAAKVAQLAAMGMEVASHSVAHSLVFSKLPLGTGREAYPGYEPFVKNRTVTRDATVLGELRISRYLLEANVPGLNVQSFRPGYLENPEALAQALDATGYRFSSSVTANNAMTHLPFRLNYNRRGVDETGVFEFPITIEDELPPQMGSRLPQALEIAAKISRYGGLFVVLTHPNLLDHKREFTRGLVDAMRPTAWFGTLASYGRWWAARDRVSMDVDSTGALKSVRLHAPESINGLSIEVPAGWRLVAALPAAAVSAQTGQQLLLAEILGDVVLQFSR